MIGLFCFVPAVLASPFKSKLRLEAENAVLRHQLIILRRRPYGRVRLTLARIRERYRAWEDSGADSLTVRSHQVEAIEVMAKVARLN